MEDHITFPSDRSSSQLVRGMESVIATVSGYHGSERFKLIKLINYTGASYVGAMTRSTTHLVCWRFEGRKYELAKNLGTIIVSHRWFEDCLKAGKRLPERHYTKKSGQQAGSLSWEVPLVGLKEKSLTSKKRNVLSDLSNTHNVTESIEMNAECLWSDSHLLSEKSSPLETRLNSHKTRNSIFRKKSKHLCRLSDECSPVESSSPGLIDVQHGESTSYCSTISARHKRNVCSTVESSMEVGPTRKGRRLVKKNACRGILESSMLDSDQETPNNLRNEDAPIILDIEQNSSAPGTYDSINENIPILQGGSSGDSFCSAENRNEVLEDAEGITEIDTLHADGVVSRVQDMPSPYGSQVSEGNMGGTQEIDGNLNGVTRFPASAELSCVICWTDFSSTRGILPCGHRFCYSCIQSWADHMAARRKVSTCPLCKARFMSITKVDDAASSDQKIYSQTVPHDSSGEDVFMLSDWDFCSSRAQSSSTSVCWNCRSREPEDLLVHCNLCSSRVVHSYCLDPPVIPWTCTHCRDLRSLYMLYQRNP